MFGGITNSIELRRLVFSVCVHATNIHTNKYFDFETDIDIDIDIDFGTD